jgi:large subunit ribosomal protein L9
LALPVTDSNRRQVEREREAAQQTETQERQVAQGVADRLAAVSCVVARRVGDTDTLYGSVTSADITESLEGQNISIDKRKIQLDEPIKELGEFTVQIKIHPDVTANLRVHVVKAQDTEGDSTADS